MTLTVVIPTRDRADLAVNALHSVLGAQRPDVTVLVSDNSTSADQRDQLRAQCADHLTERVRYVTPPEPMPMAEHWEWARQTATATFEPTHLTYVSDRGMLLDGALDELASLISRYPDRVITYKFAVVDDFIRPVRLTQPPWTGRLLELDSAAIIKVSSRGETGTYLPQMLNCVAPTTVLRAVEARFGGVFGSVSPDTCFGYRCLVVCDSILYRDKALLIHYATDRSTGGSLGRGVSSPALRDFQRVAAGVLAGDAPEPRFVTPTNGMLSEYCFVRAEAPDRRLPPLSNRGYLAAIARDVRRIENPQLRDEMTSLLRARGWRGRARFRNAAERAVRLIRYMIRHPRAAPEMIRLQLKERPPRSLANDVLSRVGINPRARDEPRFENAMEAIAYAQRYPRPRSSAVWFLAGLEEISGGVRELSA